jgi:hypothetical protein
MRFFICRRGFGFRLAFLENHPSGTFILDLSRCKSVHSRLIGMIVLLHNKFSAEKRTLKIVNVPYEVWKVFDVMNLTALLNMDDVRDGARRRRFLAPPRRPGHA